MKRGFQMFNSKWAIIIVIIIAIVGGHSVYNTNSVKGWLHSSKTKRVKDPSATNHIGAPLARNGKKVLIVYFSWGGNTRAIAQYMHETIGGDIFEITTVEKYPDSYDPCVEMAKNELENDARPELTGTSISLAPYDTVLIGYPIWWYRAPRAVLSFIERYDFSGKDVALFCTSGGDDIEETVDEIKNLKAMRGANFERSLTANVWDGILPWLRELGF